MKESDEFSLKIPEIVEKEHEFLVTQKDSVHGWKWNFSELSIPKGKPRVVLLGESVASGYFYRPEVTFGKLLRQILPEHEVIDLSRIDLQFKDLPKFRHLIQTLRPEKLILFAGNNNAVFFPQTPVTQYIEESIGWVLDLEDDTTSVQVIIPGFNFLYWKPQEIKTTVTADFNLLKKCKAKKDLNKDELQAVKRLADGCPTANYILGRHFHQTEKEVGQFHFNQSLTNYLQLEHVSPRMLPIIREEIIKRCKSKNVSYLDVQELKLEEQYLDYCHLSMSGLVELINHLPLSNIQCEVPEVDEVSVLKKVFFHSYGYGQFDYCINVLQQLKNKIPSKEFSEFISVFYEALFIDSTANFVEGYIPHSPHFFESEEYPVHQKIPNNLQFILPSKKFHAYLCSELMTSPSLPSPREKLDLLEERRCFISKRQVVDRIYRAPFLQFRQYDLEFRSYFHKSEINGDLHLSGILDLRSEASGIEVYLNHKSVSEVIRAGEVHLELSIPRDFLEDYNELKILLISKVSLPIDSIREDGLFKLHKLTLGKKE